MGRQRDRNRMAAVMASARERGMGDEPKSTGPLPDPVLDIIELQHPSPTADIRRLVTEVRGLRSVLNTLLVTRQAHEEASAEALRLASMPADEVDDAAIVAAHDRATVAESTYEAAWQRARDLMAGVEANPRG